MNGAAGERALIDDVLADPVNAALAARLPSLGLPQCHLTAGCVFQARWNRLAGEPPGHGVNDYDVFYFDDADLSWEAEDAVVQAVGALTRDLGATVEVRNQARVHLWFEMRFGTHYPRLRSAREGIDRFLIRCTCVGLDVASGELYAPDGFEDLDNGILRPNAHFKQPALFRRKAEDYRRRWPWLVVAE
ncbi:nucleotidyltransferase family protein [Mangrovibrevibacter kandeliae]|uniref:nucleotidyltransferase family protein n=1 Tax=Mangrovibrevibacter kandeliae TaxID=2968473 RepID=UPI002118D1D8|nr:nucleotidyltransferase family protein [Aurantimonas sp. CSK15Z-1]MCQ8783003.1 nucleotidyltransferase family protein [Aurantimonas sp. CSK15Z-1]